MRFGRKQKEITKPPFNREKFENLILYIVSKVPNPVKLGAVRLRKILYFADSINYLRKGEPITGATYIKWTGGPVPREFPSSLDRLQRDGAIVEKPGQHPLGHPMKFYYALKEPNYELFQPEEISLVDDLIREICDEFTAEGISEASHTRAWELADVGEELPYYTVFVTRFGEVDEATIEWAKERIAHHERKRAAAR